jgi:hypothetical protein
MRSPLPAADDFAAFEVIELDVDGALQVDGARVAPAGLDDAVAGLLPIPPGSTDVFVFMHGWQTTAGKAAARTRRLFAGIRALRREQPARYPAIARFRPLFIAVRWPAKSSPLPVGYRQIRDRAHAMTTTGQAVPVLAALLRHLDRTRRAQRLHCVGHSFGGRILGEAIAGTTDVTLDSFVAFQLAAAPDVFDHRFAALADGSTPVAGPVALTFSEHDRALSNWHRSADGTPGVGAVGAAGWPIIKLRPTGEAYGREEFAKVTNVDASWLFRQGALSFPGAHGDIWYPESVHLLLSLADFSR